MQNILRKPERKRPIMRPGHSGRIILETDLKDK
jgi:hypothetical protein